MNNAPSYFSTGDDAAVFLELEFAASEPYTRFVFDTESKALRVRQYLLERQLCEFSPPFGSLLRVDGRAVGMIAVLSSDDLARCRLRAAMALRKSGLLLEVSLAARVQLASQTLMRPQPGDYYISRVAVSPAARGAGHGRRLLGHAEAIARSASAQRLVLEVAPESKAALGLYRDLGFNEVSRKYVAEAQSGRQLIYLHMVKHIS